MKYADTDLQALKSPDTMRAYAEARLDGRAVGRSYKCACPWGLHNDTLKVEITEYNGQGRATCWACGKQSVNIFELAAATSGIPNDKEHFAELMEHVADVTGYKLTTYAPRRRARRLAAAAADAAWCDNFQNGNSHAFTPSTAGGCMQGGATGRPHAASPTAGVSRLCAADAAEDMAWEAVERAARNPERLAMFAAGFGLPARALTVHADMECASMGLIGLSPGGLLLFISTRATCGNLKVTAIKARAPKHGTAPAEVIEDGRWVARGTLDAARKGGKFRACITGAGAHLWGGDAIAGHDTVIITEGESDKLAVDCSVDAFRTAWQTGLDKCSEYVPEQTLPAVVACAGARAFKSEWARLFKGKVVYICGDNDTAGQEGLTHTAALLLDAGVKDVRIWTPRHGYKDARDQFHAARPAELMEDIISRAEPFYADKRA